MSENKQRRARRSYTDELKQQIITLYRNGKRKCDICREYDIGSSLLDKWLKQEKNSGSFHEKDNWSQEQQEKQVIGNGERHFKTSSADFTTKVNVIRAKYQQCVAI